jgi:hypothetical protein
MGEQGSNATLAMEKKVMNDALNIISETIKLRYCPN